MGENINISGPGSKVMISALKYERSAADGTEPEWLSCSVECSVGPFHAKMDLPLATEDIRRFRDSLAEMLAAVKGEARMDTIENRIGIRVEMGKRGNATVSGTISYHSGPQGTLSFKFETDQSYLAQSLAQTDHVLEVFPERGSVSSAS